jgi:hypothetical protein
VSSTPPEPVFPGGMDTAPELEGGHGCAHDPCLCSVSPGRRYCSPACARTGLESEICECNHFGCNREF